MRKFQSIFLKLFFTFDRILVESIMNLYLISFLQKMKYLKYTHCWTPCDTLPLVTCGECWSVAPRRTSPSPIPMRRLKISSKRPKQPLPTTSLWSYQTVTTLEWASEVRVCLVVSDWLTGLGGALELSAGYGAVQGRRYQRWCHII